MRLKVVFMLLAVAFVQIVIAARARAECTFELVDDYSVIAGGVEWRHIEYGWVCVATSGGGSTDPDDGGSDPGDDPPGPTTPPAEIAIVAMDDGNPSQLKMLVMGSHDITSTDVRLNGSSIGKYFGDPSSGIVVSGPSLYSLPIGQSIVGVLGCRPNNDCAWDSFYIYRTQRTSGKSSTLTATWTDLVGGLPVVRASLYSFNLAEEWIETRYEGVSPVSNATRVQFSKGRTGLGYNTPGLTPYPMYTATHWLRNLGPRSSPDPTRNSQSMMGCSTGSFISGYNTWVSACATQTGIGGGPTAGVSINKLGFQVSTAKGIVPALIINNELEYAP